MSNGVEFEEDKYGIAQRQAAHFAAKANGSSKMAKWLIDKGIVSSDAQAQVVLLAVVVINIIVSFIVIKYFL